MKKTLPPATPAQGPLTKLHAQAQTRMQEILGAVADTYFEPRIQEGLGELDGKFGKVATDVRRVKGSLETLHEGILEWQKAGQDQRGALAKLEEDQALTEATLVANAQVVRGLQDAEAELASALLAQAEDVRGLHTASEELLRVVEEQRETILDLHSTDADLRTGLDRQGAGLGAQVDRHEQLASTVGGLHRAVEELRAAGTCLGIGLNQQQTRLEALEEDHRQLATRVEEHQRTLGDLRTAGTTLDTALDLQRTALKALEDGHHQFGTRVGEQQETLDEVRTMGADALGALQRLREGLDGQTGAILTLQAQLGKRIADLEAFSKRSEREQGLLLNKLTDNQGRTRRLLQLLSAAVLLETLRIVLSGWLGSWRP